MVKPQQLLVWTLKPSQRQPECIQGLCTLNEKQCALFSANRYCNKLAFPDVTRTNNSKPSKLGEVHVLGRHHARTSEGVNKPE